MDTQKAIEYFSSKLGRTLSSRRRQAYEVALEALEKQEAKKVEKKMIRPRYKGERGGTLTMSMKKNIPEPRHKDWKLTTCPQCGQQCWESELARQCLKKDKTLKALCTECALGGKR